MSRLLCYRNVLIIRLNFISFFFYVRYLITTNGDTWLVRHRRRLFLTVLCAVVPNPIWVLNMLVFNVVQCLLQDLSPRNETSVNSMPCLTIIMRTCFGISWELATVGDLSRTNFWSYGLSTCEANIRRSATHKPN